MDADKLSRNRSKYALYIPLISLIELINRMGLSCVNYLNVLFPNFVNKTYFNYVFFTIN